MGVAIITDLDFSNENIGQVTLIKRVPLESLTITKGEQVENQVPFNVVYVPASTYQRGIVWSVSGSANVSIDPQTGVLSILPNALNDSIVVTAASTDNQSISASMQTTVTFSDSPIVFKSSDIKAALLPTFDTNNDGEISMGEVYTQAFTTELKNFATAAPFNEFKYFKGTTSIETQAFQSSKITEITLPSTIKTIGRSAFESMPYLKKLVVPEGVETLSATCIQVNSKLVFLDLPSTLTAIGYAGIDISASEAVLICRATTPPSFAVGSSVIPADGKIYVPDNSVDSYKAASGWSNYSSKIYPLSEYKD